MSATTGNEITTIGVPKALKSRLDDLKPYESMSYAELLDEMAGVYADEGRAP